MIGMVFFVLAAPLAPFSFAQDPAKPESAPAAEAMGQEVSQRRLDPEEIKRRFHRLEEERNERRHAASSQEGAPGSGQERREAFPEERWEQLKKTNPRAYEALNRARERGSEIEGIVAKARGGKLPEEEARKRLYPLLKESHGPELSELRDRIARMEKQLAFLKKAEKNPDLLVHRRIDEMLGKPPEETE